MFLLPFFFCEGSLAGRGAGRGREGAKGPFRWSLVVAAPADGNGGGGERERLVIGTTSRIAGIEGRTRRSDDTGRRRWQPRGGGVCNTTLSTAERGEKMLPGSAKEKMAVDVI